MQTIQIHRNKLYSIVEENREKYRDLYDKAQATWKDVWAAKKEEVVATLATETVNFTEAVDQFLQTDPDAFPETPEFNTEILDTLGHFIREHKPVDHRATFDRALAMLGLETREEITLTETEFKTLVQNQWPWREQEIGKARALLATTTSLGLSGPTGTTGSDGLQGAITRYTQ